jgi:hypothetical protein
MLTQMFPVSMTACPLTPELNPCMQCQPAEIFYWGFQILILALRKKMHISWNFHSNLMKFNFALCL